MSLMLGLSLIMGAVSVSFAADDKKEETPKKRGKKKKETRCAKEMNPGFLATPSSLLTDTLADPSLTPLLAFI
jgi:hypothetical protein